MIYIDAHNYLKRIYHGGGSPYSLFYNLMTKYAAKHIQIICDGPKSREYRKEIHPGYKAGRNNGDDPIYWEVYNNCKELALHFPNTKVIDMTAGEADDYIAWCAEEYDTIISNDKDLWPLIDKGVDILLNASTKVDNELVEMKFNCSPKHIQLYKTLVGDPSDKIPGKRGFGPAAWAKLDYEDRELYNHHFKINNCNYDPDLMTEQACMSWKLALPWSDYTFTVVPELALELRNPLAFCEEKGIIL